jgi:hypothetical protein
MTDISDVKVGDRVRISYEDVAVEVTSAGIQFKNLWNPINNLDNLNVTVDILERAKPKVGDVVSGSQYDELPNGTIITSIDSADHGYVKASGRWYVVAGRRSGQAGASYPADHAAGKRTVKYLPE